MNSASHTVSTIVFHQIHDATDCKTHHRIVDQERQAIPIKLRHAFDCNTSLFQKCYKGKKHIILELKKYGIQVLAITFLLTLKNTSWILFYIGTKKASFLLFINGCIVIHCVDGP